MWVSFSATIVVGTIVVGVNDVRTISLLVVEKVTVEGKRGLPRLT